MNNGETQENRVLASTQYVVGDSSYERLFLSRLIKSDIGHDDRIFIQTESGNRYMIRWSKSKNAPKIYSERAKFKDEQILHDQYSEQDSIAEVGKPFSFVVQLTGNKGQKMDATKVVQIEIRKNIDSDIESGELAARGQNILQKLKDVVTGRKDQDSI